MKSLCKSLLVLLVMLSASVLVAQNKEEATINEVNSQLWEPFKKAFNNRDWKAFNTLHTDDVLRVSKWGIREGEAHKNRVKESYTKSSKKHRSIDFSFEHRIYKGNTGYEVGYYRIVYKEEGRPAKTSYARFHVRLRKVNGQWKIAQDWDTGVVGDRIITEEDFNSGTLLQIK